jgi:hypothetical protein
VHHGVTIAEARQAWQSFKNEASHNLFSNRSVSQICGCMNPTTRHKHIASDRI